MRKQDFNHQVLLYPEHCLENGYEFLGPKVERTSLTWQTKQILAHA